MAAQPRVLLNNLNLGASSNLVGLGSASVGGWRVGGPVGGGEVLD